MPRTKNPLKLDPSRTALLRRSFVADMNRRFTELIRVVREAIVTQDAFGLAESKPFTFNLNAPGSQAWRFMEDDAKLGAFNTWFQRQTEEGILSTGTVPPWTSKYVDSAYRKGVVRAYTDVHKADLVGSHDFYEGSKKQFLESAFMQPETLSKIRLLSTRTFEELKGINAAMGQQVSRSLAGGLAAGHHPRKIARDITKTIGTINKTRARVLARTEIIHAHAEGQLDSFEQLGIEEVGVMAEWSTAGDDRVCALCGELEGTVMTIAEARGLLPRHPNCRCAWIPANVGEKKKGRMWTKPQKEHAVSKSIQKELPSSTKKVAWSRSTWVGKEKRFRTPSKATIAKGKAILLKKGTE